MKTTHYDKTHYYFSIIDNDSYWYSSSFSTHFLGEKLKLLPSYNTFFKKFDTIAHFLLQIFLTITTIIHSILTVENDKKPTLFEDNYF